MFTLQIEGATNEELGKNYLEIETYLAEGFDAERSRIYDELMELTSQSEAGANVAAKLKKKKEELEDFDLKGAACRRRLEILGRVIGARRKEEAERRLLDLPGENVALQEEEENLRFEFLGLIAQALFVKERIEGGNFTARGGQMHDVSLDYNFSIRSLSDADLAVLREEIAALRQSQGEGNGSISLRRGRLTREEGALHKILEGSPAEDLQNFLAGLREPIRQLSI